MLKFIHIPKNAGTSIENVGLKHDIYWGFREWTKKDHKKNENIFKNKNIIKNSPKNIFVFLGIEIIVI